MAAFARGQARPGQVVDPKIVRAAGA